VKWIAGVLLLANLAIGGYFLWVRDGNTLQSNQYIPLNADKIVLQSVHLADGYPRKPTEAAIAAASEQICVEWRGLLESDLDRGREAIKTLAAQRVLSVEELPVNRMYWVIFPPLPTQASSEVKLRELKALKVQEALVISDGIWKNGISLGLFANEEAARRRLREIETAGISGLRLETKPKEGTAYFYLIKSEDIGTLKDLDTIRQTFPATTLTRVACKK
jgi:hypothetical protein